MAVFATTPTPAKPVATEQMAIKRKLLSKIDWEAATDIVKKTEMNRWLIM